MVGKSLKSFLTDSVQKKLVVTVAVTAILIFSLMMFFTISQATGQVSQVTDEKLEAKSDALANDLNAEMKENQKFAQTLSSTMENYDKGTASRAEVNNMLEQLAKDNPKALGVYVAYEPNAFDGKDAHYREMSAPGTNEAGRYAPYWNRYGGSLNLVPLNDLESQEWYTKPMKTGEPMIKGPFEYKDRLMLSYLYPIKRGGETVGVAGVDVSIDYWQQRTDQIQVLDSGYAFVVSKDGKFVAHPKDSWVGSRTLSTVAEKQEIPALQRMDQRVESGDGGNFTMMDPVTGSKAVAQYQPVETGGFAIATVAPKNEVLAGVNQLRNTLLGISGVSLLVLLGVVFVITRRVTDPIETVTADLEQIAETGDLSIRSDVETNDEVGEMAASLHKTLDDTQQSMDHIRGAIQDLRDGNLENDIQTDLPGEYGRIMEALDEGLAQVDESFAQIRQASESIKRGQVDQDVDTDQPGQYGKVLDNLAAGTQQLSESFSQILEASEGLKNGQLDQEFETDLPGAYGKVMEDLAAGFEDINESVAQVQEIADTVADTSQQVTASTEEIETASQEVAESVQEISHGADEQSDNLQQVANEMNDLSATVEEIASSASQVADNASTAVDHGETGKESASAATAEINEIEAEAEAAVEQVSSLDDEMEQIGEIVQMINDIAEQTNLLALNASIEAARAGEAGEGFAVVADEIKTLAGEAADATAAIEERIDEVQSSTSETVEGIEEMKVSVESGAETIEETIQMFDDIAESINEVENGVKEISDATDDQATSTEEVVAMVDEVSSVAEETAAEASNVSAASEEQTSSLSNVGQNVENLSNVAERLHELVDQFEVDQKGISRDAFEEASSQAAATDGGSAAGSESDDSSDWKWAK